MDGVRLHVVLTGGSSTLPMMKALDEGMIEFRGFRILRTPVDPRPEWKEVLSPELSAVYPQLAVAIGGVTNAIRETFTAPPVIAGAGDPTVYKASSSQLAGN